MFTDDRQALWWSLVAGSFFWFWGEADSPCDGPWWLGASSGTGERQAVPVMVPGGWYCTGELWGALASLVLCWGAMGSPGFAGTVLGGCGEPWLCWYCAGGLWGALALLVLCWGLWGALVLLVLCWGLWGALASLVLCWGLWEALVLLVLCWGLWGALASLVLCWGAVGSRYFAGKLRNKFLKFPECFNRSKYCFTSL